MTTPSTTPAGAPCWIDLMTSDVARSREFYGELFGWTAGDASAEFGGYFMFMHDGVPIAGAMPNPPGFAIADQWSVYLAVEDARTTTAAALAAGATVREDAIEIADLGTSAVITDPGGARIGLWQSNTFGGLPAVAGTNAPGWFELHTRDYDRSVAFYRDVFGWDAQTAADTPQFRYTTLGRDEAARAGIMDASGFLAEGQGAAWSVYFTAEDTDGGLDRITALGGSVVMPAEDTPYGRLATATDPTGAAFKLIGPTLAQSGS